jgi:hypothetical protein
MPCYRCGVRQTDPGRGQSPWKRGVRRETQVLICPDCQSDADWMAEMDRCARCSSVHLVRRLGEVECRDCGAVVPPAGGSDEDLGGETVAGAGAAGEVATPAALTRTDPSRNPDLSEEVARALERVLRQGLVSQRPHRAGTADSR